MLLLINIFRSQTSIGILVNLSSDLLKKGEYKRTSEVYKLVLHLVETFYGRNCPIYQ